MHIKWGWNDFKWCTLPFLWTLTVWKKELSIINGTGLKSILYRYVLDCWTGVYLFVCVWCVWIFCVICFNVSGFGEMLAMESITNFSIRDNKVYFISCFRSCFQSIFHPWWTHSPYIIAVDAGDQHLPFMVIDEQSSNHGGCPSDLTFHGGQSIL